MQSMHRWNEILQRKGEEKSFHFPAIHNARFGIPCTYCIACAAAAFQMYSRTKGMSIIHFRGKPPEVSEMCISSNMVS